MNKCPECGAPVVVKNGKYGEFYGCSNYPACKFTATKEFDTEFSLEEWQNVKEYEESMGEYYASLNG